MESAENEFEDLLDSARTLLGDQEDVSDLWEANDLVNQALALRPHDALAWLVKAQVLSALDDDVAALASIEMAGRRGPKVAEIHYWRSAILSDLERYPEALKSIERALRFLGPEDDWLIEEIYCEKAMALEAVGRHDDALATFEAGLLRFPDSILLKAGIEPLKRERMRSQFRVLPGGLK